MAKFIKSALKVGETFIDGNGKPVPVTAERLRHWNAMHRKLKGNRYSVPIAWDHADTQEGIDPIEMDLTGTKPKKKTRSAENTIGHMADIQLAQDGQSAEITLKVTDPKARGRARRNEVYISPVIQEVFKDGKGNEYPDVITHVDFVNYPVDHSQGPFKEIPEVAPGNVALAIRMGLDKPCTFMGDPPPTKDDDGDEDDDKDGVDNEDEDDAEDDVNSPERVSRVIEALKPHDLVLPDDTDASNFMERLEVALGVKAAIEGKGNGDDANAGAAAAGNSQVKVTDPGGGFQGMSLNDPYRVLAEKQHQDSVKVRLKNLLETGRCTPAEFAAKEPAVKVIKLSLAADKVTLEPSKLEEWLDSREAVPAGTFWTDQERVSKTTQLSLVQPPENLREQTDEEAEARVDRMFGKKSK